jgi:acetylornithine deacetylase
MKGFIAVALALVPEFVARDLSVPLHFALSYDEEIGCAGVPSMIAKMAGSLDGVRAIIVGEPTSMRVVSANKGIRTFTTRVRGVDAHSSQTHKALSAIAVAAELIETLSKLAADALADADPDSPFEPPATTINIGRIEGGTATNIVPRDCAFDWEYRSLPDADDDLVWQAFRQKSDALLADLRARHTDADIRTEAHVRVPGLRVMEGSPAVSLAMALAGTNETHAVAYAAEAGLFQEAGFPAVICGPGHVAQAHTANEFVEIAQLDECERFLRKLMDVVCVKNA